MAISYWAGGWITGLSSDTKPDNSGLNGYRFLETDTGNTFYHDGSSWSIIIVSPQINDYEYTVYKTGSTYKALNMKTGVVDSSGTTDAAVQINAAIDAINDTGEGGNIHLKGQATYTCNTVINIADQGARSIGLIGDGWDTFLDCDESTSRADGINVQMGNVRLKDFRITADSNISHMIGFAGGHKEGRIENILFDGGSIVTDQVGLYEDGNGGGVPGFWTIENCLFNLIDIGFMADGSAGTAATATRWNNITFSDVNVGMDIGGAEHQGTNIWHQGNTTNGITTIRFRGSGTGVGQSCQFANVMSELLKTSTNCQTILFDSGGNCKYNQIFGAANYNDDGGIHRTVVDNSGNQSNTVIFMDNIQAGPSNVLPTLKIRRLDADVIPRGGRFYRNMKKYGSHGLQGSGTTGDGILNNFLTDVGSFNASHSNTHGVMSQWTTGSTTGDQAGFRTNGGITRRIRNTDFYSAFSLNQTADTLLFLGFTSNGGSFESGTDPLNGTSGIMLNVNGGNFRVAHNDGTGATVFTDFSSTRTVSTSLFSFRIVADNDTPSYYAELDTGSTLYTATLTSDIPAEASTLYAQCHIETQADAAKIFYVSCFEGMF